MSKLFANLYICNYCLSYTTSEVKHDHHERLSKESKAIQSFP